MPQTPKYDIYDFEIGWEFVTVFLRQAPPVALVEEVDISDAATYIYRNEVQLSFDPYYIWPKTTVLAQKRKLFSELKHAAERYGWDDPDNMLTVGWDTLRSQVWEKFIRAFPLCQPCQVHHSQTTFGRWECASCGEERCDLGVQAITARLARRTLGYLCLTCYGDRFNNIETIFPDARNCSQCRRVELTSGIQEIDDRMLCSYCTARLPTCTVCSQRVGDGGRRVQGYGTVHEECGETLPTLGEIRYWDYKPAPIFFPDVPENPLEPLYVGMELEVSRNYDEHHNPELAAMQFLGALPEFFYAKSDSSVTDGFEIVTHPMQPLWALENFPFDLFQSAIDEGYLLEEHDSAGTHMHMNKDSFVPAHMWKFLQLHFRLPKFCEAVGGRRNSTWAKFAGRDQERLRRDLMNIAKKKGEPNFDRYVAVNLRNEYTIELRYPKGGINPDEIKKNLEWAHAAYSYTNQLSVGDINEGAIQTADHIIEFINNDSTYDELSEWIEHSGQVGWRWEKN